MFIKGGWRKLIIVLSKYMDGEIKEIIGVAYNKEIAKIKVKELNNSVVKSDNYFYTHEEFEFLR